MSKTKSFEIPKIAVMQAYEKVKANKQLFSSTSQSGRNTEEERGKKNARNTNRIR